MIWTCKKLLIIDELRKCPSLKPKTFYEKTVFSVKKQIGGSSSTRAENTKPRNERSNEFKCRRCLRWYAPRQCPTLEKTATSVIRRIILQQHVGSKELRKYKCLNKLTWKPVICLLNRYV